MLVEYIAALLAGLALAMRVMVAGVVRPAPAVVTPRSMPMRRTRRSPALGAVGGAGLVLRLWPLNPGAPPDAEDDIQHQLQGFPATVSGALSAAGIGEITFRYGGVRRVLPARAVDVLELANGAHVVIDPIDSDTAWVESWAQVETRLQVRSRR